jgi:chemotaxis regulatin CheY-phosphate phosphatase CheZ
VESHQTNSLNSAENAALVDEIARLAPKAKAGHFDELHDTNGSLRSHWKTFFNQLGPSGLTDLDQRTTELTRQVRENGITYNIYADELLTVSLGRKFSQGYCNAQNFLK